MDNKQHDQTEQRTGEQTSLDANWTGQPANSDSEDRNTVNRAVAVRTTATNTSHPPTPTPDQTPHTSQSQTQWTRHANAHQFPVDVSSLVDDTVTWVRSRGQQPADVSPLLDTVTPTHTWERHASQRDFPPDISTLLSTRTGTSRDTSSSRTMRPVSSYASTSIANDTTNESTDDHRSQRVPESDIMMESCPECGGDIVHSGNDQYCDDCGLLVVETEIDTGPEWRAFDANEQDEKSRVGGPVRESMHDKGLSTVIGTDNTDAMGQPIKHSQQKKMDRLRTWDDRFKVQNSQERNMRQAFGEIQRIASEVDLPEYVIETASTVYRRALEEELIPGRSIEAMATACVYIAIRQANIPKTVDEVLQYSRVDEDRVTAAYSYISRELGLEIEPPKVREHLAPIASALDISAETEQQARDILETAIENSVHSGKSPSGLAASAVYAATIITQEDAVTQEQAADAGNVCKLTIRSRYRELLDTVDVDIDDVTAPSISN